MSALSVFAGIFFELPCCMFPLALAVVSAGACDRLAVEIKLGVGLRSACNWLSALDSVPGSEAESEAAEI